MFLSRLFLNPRSRVVRTDLADPGQLHRTVMRAFPPDIGATPRKDLGVLWRVDDDPNAGRVALLVQSAAKPDWSCLPEGYVLGPADAFSSDHEGHLSVRDVSDERAALRVGDALLFRLRANTTRKIDTKTRPDGTKSNGQRVPVTGDEARMAWLARHAAARGFVVESARVAELPSVKSRARDLTLGGAQFDGVLTVTDEVLFRTRALAEGIGPAKAFGMGLLSVIRAPIR
jgi:CRISPR system Cascade subunit CasE